MDWSVFRIHYFRSFCCFFTSGWFRVKAGSVLGMGWMVEMVYYTCGGWGWLCGI